MTPPNLAYRLTSAADFVCRYLFFMGINGKTETSSRRGMRFGGFNCLRYTAFGRHER